MQSHTAAPPDTAHSQPSWQAWPPHTPASAGNSPAVVHTSPESFTRRTVPADGGARQQSGAVEGQRLASSTRAVPAAHSEVSPSFEHAPPKSPHVVGPEVVLPGSPLLLLAPAPVVEDEHPTATTITSARP